MRIKSKGLNSGYYGDQYGKRGTEPNVSIPFTIEDAPENTVSYAILLEDIDAIPVCGFAWIHWVAANIKRTSIEENESKTATDFVQGLNSSWSELGGASKKEAVGFLSFGPPDRPHQYDLYVYALDCELDLEEGFYMNEMMHKMQGHVLAQAKLPGIYVD